MTKVKQVYDIFYHLNLEVDKISGHVKIQRHQFQGEESTFFPGFKNNYLGKSPKVLQKAHRYKDIDQSAISMQDKQDAKNTKYFT